MKATGSWIHQGGRRYSLVDHDGVQRGTFDRPNWTIKDATATVGPTPIVLTGSGMINRKLTATAPGAPTMTMEVNGLSWNGQVLLGGGVWPVDRHVMGGLRWVVGDEEQPLMTMWAHHRRADLSFVPSVADTDPGLLPLMLLLMQHHVRGKN